jgi:hypothetical protein
MQLGERNGQLDLLCPRCECVYLKKYTSTYFKYAPWRARRSQPSRVKQILGFRRAASAWRTVSIHAPRRACTAHSPPGGHRTDLARRAHCHPATTRTLRGGQQQHAPPCRVCAAYAAAGYVAQAVHGGVRCCRPPRRVRAVAGWSVLRRAGTAGLAMSAMTTPRRPVKVFARCAAATSATTSIQPLAACATARAQLEHFAVA